MGYQAPFFPSHPALGACSFDQIKEGELPEVEVNASGCTVNVGTENKTIEVPTVDVDAPKDDAKE